MNDRSNSILKILKSLILIFYVLNFVDSCLFPHAARFDATLAHPSTTSHEIGQRIASAVKFSRPVDGVLPSFLVHTRLKRIVDLPVGYPSELRRRQSAVLFASLDSAEFVRPGGSIGRQHSLYELNSLIQFGVSLNRIVDEIKS